ncbi:MAG: hypothetical protein ACXWRZ_13540 [Bdellovibrio sp.]
MNLVLSQSRLFSKKYILFLLLSISAQISWGACDQTLSPGATLATAIANAAAGSTICLNAGTYAEENLIGVSKSSDVTVRSVTGRTASVAFYVRHSNHLKFQNLTIYHLDMNNDSVFNTNISVLNNTFTGQMLVSGSADAGVDVNIVVDSNTFDGINICSGCYTGRLQLWGITGVKITNNHFGGGGTADGILWGGYGGTVGPGNVFDGISQTNAGTSGAHIDNIQLNGNGLSTAPGAVHNAGIIGNYFKNGTTYIMAPDGSSYITVKDNVFDNCAEHNGYAIQFGTTDGTVFEHNTIKCTGAAFDSKPANLASSNVIVRNNILTDVNFKVSSGNGCSNCTFTHNMFGSGTNAQIGTDNLLGDPTWIGGLMPSNWAGWQLSSNSLGYKAALDGMDMGTRVYGPSTSSTIILMAPTNLRVN